MGSFPSTSSISRGLKVSRSFTSRKITVQNTNEKHAVPSTYINDQPARTLNSEHLTIVRSSWKKIKNGSALGLQNFHHETGLVLFYDAYYKILFKKAEVLREYFPGLKTRGGILHRIINFVCSVDISKKTDCQKKLKSIGTSHKKKNIRPWMHLLFADTIVSTVMLCLGQEACARHSEAWAAVLGFCLSTILKEEINNGINLSADFPEMPAV